jgi:two-component sensor histidine kinase
MPLLTHLQGTVTREPPGLASTAFWIGIGVAAPTAVRMALDPLLGATLWFPTYYPAALVATLFLGWRAGLIVVLLSAMAANYFFVLPRHNIHLGEKEIAGTVVFLMADAVIVVAAGLLRTALVRLQAANDREKALNAELQHRMKNTLAVVQGLIAQTAKRGVHDPKEFQRSVEGRLEALASAHDVLSTGHWESCELLPLVERVLAPFQDHGRITVKGPPYTLRAECCVPLVLALHELGTNAVKYGALSVEQGAVELTWCVTDDAKGAILVHWQEHNGPVVTEPKRRGLGTRLLLRHRGSTGGGRPGVKGSDVRQPSARHRYRRRDLTNRFLRSA